MGDRVRLFQKVDGALLNAAGQRRRGRPVRVGVNGDVVRISGFTRQGFTVARNGQQVEVTWHSLRDQDTGRVRLSAGEVHTIDASQGADRHLWCNLMPDGAGIGMRRSYVAESRQRVQTYTVVGEDAERQAIARERGLGSRASVTRDDVLGHMARALARPSEKSSALRFAETIAALRAPAAEIAAQEKRKAQLDHARILDREDAWARQARPSRSSDAVKHVVPRVQELAVERVAGPPLHRMAKRMGDTMEAMRATYGRLLDATRLREGPDTAAAVLQATIERLRSKVTTPYKQRRSVRLSPTP